MVKKKSVHTTKAKALLSIAVAVLIIGLAIHLFKNHSPKSNIIPSSNPIQAQSTANNQSSNSASSGSSTPSGNTKITTPASGSGSTDLVAPYGSFVSNHHPNGSDQIGSVCITTPGAACYIQFTNGSSTKQLAVQTTSGDGSTNWVWSVSGAGLSKGNWQIAAVASLNGQTKTTADPSPLEVQ